MPTMATATPSTFAVPCRNSRLLAPRAWEGDAAIAAVAAGTWRGLDRTAIRSSGYVVHTLKAALWAVDRTESFEEALVLQLVLARRRAAHRAQGAQSRPGRADGLLDAFDAMAASERGPRLLPPGQPLDLFVTVTDFHGHPQRLR